jgi:hypothetical protein
LYRRQQASFSTSEVSTKAAAQRANVIAAAKAQCEYFLGRSPHQSMVVLMMVATP